MVKNPPANAGDIRDMGFIPGSGRSPRVGNDNPLQYSFLENPMGRGVCWVTTHMSQRVGHKRATEPACMPSFSEDSQMMSSKRESTYT